METKLNPMIQKAATNKDNLHEKKNVVHEKPLFFYLSSVYIFLCTCNANITGIFLT